MRTFILCGIAFLAMAISQLSTAAASRANEPIQRNATFIMNGGQFPDHVLFVARQRGADVWVTTKGVTIDAYETKGELRTGSVHHEALNTGGQAPRLITHSEVNGTFSFFRNGNSTGITVPSYSEVTLVDVVPGVSAQFTVRGDGRVERTWLASDQGALRSLTLADRGGKGQHVADVTVPTSTVFGAYIGGSDADNVVGVEVLSNKEVVVAGTTNELVFPATVGGYAKNVMGAFDGFVMRCDASLKRILAYTFIGGVNYDRIRALTIDAQNNIYVCGETKSTDLPVSSSATNKILRGGIDAFVAKFDSTLTKHLVGFYHGGNLDDIPRAIAVDAIGGIVLAGSTTSTSLLPVTTPTTAVLSWSVPRMGGAPRQYSVTISNGRTNSGQTDGFVATFTDYGGLQQSRYYGREGVDYINAVKVDAPGYIYLLGVTSSQSFEAVPARHAEWSGRVPFDASYNGGTSDAFVVKMSPSLTFSQTDGITFATLLGGNGTDEGRVFQLDERNQMDILCTTTSSDMPIDGASAKPNAGKKDIFFARLDAVGARLTSGTHFGGAGDDDATCGRSLAGSSRMYVAGTTTSMDLPLVGEGIVEERLGTTDGFIAVLDLGAPSYATLVAGNEQDTIVGVTIDALGDLYYAANTTSTTLATHDSSFARQAMPNVNGYVAKHAFGILRLVSPSGGEAFCIGASQPITWAAAGLNDTAKYRVQYAEVATGIWKDAAGNIAGRNYSWKIPTTLAPGEYLIRVMSYHGHESLLLQPVTISRAPAITQQPTNINACSGSSAVLEVTVVGANLRYQWRKAGVAIADATSNRYQIASLTAASVGSYDCVISGACATALTSAAATVAISASTMITKQPSAVTVLKDQPFTVSVTATGSTLTYQWTRNGDAVAGATSATYTVAASAKSHEGSYQCTVTGGCGSATSEAVAVVVNDPTSVDRDDEASTAGAFIIGPHPAGMQVSVGVVLTNPEEVAIRIFDLQGRLITFTTLGSLPSGFHALPVSTVECGAGMHVFEVSMGHQTFLLNVLVQR